MSDRSIDIINNIDRCSICFENMLNDIYRLDCAHRFHKQCVTEWLTRKQTCPLCRRPHSYEDDNKVMRLEEVLPLLGHEEVIMNYMLARFSVPFLGRLLETALRNTSQPLLNHESPITEYITRNEDDWLPIAIEIVRLLRN